MINTCLIITLYLDFDVRFTSYIQTPILDIASTPMGFTYEYHLRPPNYLDPLFIRDRRVSSRLEGHVTHVVRSLSLHECQ